MMHDKHDFLPFAGYTRIMSVSGDKITQLAAGRNEVMYGLIEATARLFGGGAGYKVGAMYFEFQNLASPSDTPDYPSFDAADDVSYYLGLESSLDRDFVRVPILNTPGMTETGTATWLSSYYAMTPSGTATGFWGKAFSAAANSVVIGGALVACPDADNQSKDIVLCRNYPDGAKIAKATGEQISMAWNVEFSYPGLSS